MPRLHVNVRFLNATCLALGVCALGLSARAQAGGCSNSSLIGAFGYQEEGQVALGDTFFQFRADGILRFDGNGHGTRLTTLWYDNGQVVSEPVSGITYAVSPDCRFTFAYTVNSETFAGVIVGSGRKVLYIETTGNPARSGQAERIRDF